MLEYYFYHGFGLKAFEGRHIRILNNHILTIAKLSQLIQLTTCLNVIATRPLKKGDLQERKYYCYTSVETKWRLSRMNKALYR